MKYRARLYGIFRIWILFIFIYSMYPWFAWSIPQYIITIITVVLIIFVGTQSKLFGTYRPSKAVSFFALLTCLLLNDYSFFSLIVGLSLWVCIYFMIILKEEYKSDLIEFITKWFAILSLLSLIGFLLYRFGIPLPSQTVFFKDDAMAGYGEFENYYLFVTMWRSGGFRFQSIFAEPGHYTMGLAPIIFINKYNWKNPYVLILMIAQLFTFSLAGYIVFVVGYLYIVISERRFSAVMVKSLSFVSIGIVFILLSSYFYEDDMLQSLIIERIDGGDFSRADELFDVAYASLLKSSDVLFGRGVYDIDAVATGYKQFVYVHGILGLICCVIMYISMVYIYKRQYRKYLYGLLIVQFLLLYQNDYPFWWCMLIPLFLGSSYMVANDNN